MESTQMTKRNWINVILMGFGFFFVFTAFQTTAFVQGVTLDSFLAPNCTNRTHDGGIPISDKFSKRVGYISLCVIYLMVAIGNWVSVPVVTMFGSKWSMVISGALYVVYIVAVIRPYIPTLFFGAAMLGSAGGVLWTAQGQTLFENSSKEKMSATSGIFWLMLQMSLVVGNMFVFLYLKFRVRDKTCIPPVDNYIIFGVFSLMGVIGVVLMIFIWPVKKRSFSPKQVQISSSTSSLNEGENKKLISEGTEDSLKVISNELTFISACHQVKDSLGKALKLMLSWDQILLFWAFIYTGYELNFWSGVYGTVVGRTHEFPKYAIGLAGLFVGIGEILGGGLFGILGKYTNRFGKDPIVLLGLIVHLCTFLLIFYNIPSKAVFDDIPRSDSKGYLFNPSNIYIAILCAFLLGFGDACFNTQIYALLGTIYPTEDKSVPAMALFKFFQSLAAMVGFLTSNVVNLQWQLLVLVILGTVGTVAFANVEWRHKNTVPEKLNLTD